MRAIGAVLLLGAIVLSPGAVALSHRTEDVANGTSACAADLDPSLPWEQEDGVVIPPREVCIKNGQVYIGGECQEIDRDVGDLVDKLRENELGQTAQAANSGSYLLS